MSDWLILQVRKEIIQLARVMPFAAPKALDYVEAHQDEINQLHESCMSISEIADHVCELMRSK